MHDRAVLKFEVWSTEQYRDEYGALAKALGCPDAAPAPGELEFLAEINARERYPFGMLGPPDVYFLAGFASILQPHVAIEIGTASGFSTAILAKMIALRVEERATPRAGRFVHTIDYKERYSEDPTKPIGFGIDLIVPELAQHIGVHRLKDSSLCATLVRPGELSLAFIDGNHGHPWPLTDLIEMLPLLHRAGWIVLHDIDLPARFEAARQAGAVVPEFSPFGAKYVFDAWPGDKIRGGNIGAINSRAKPAQIAAFVDALRKLPAEVSEASARKRWREIERILKTAPLSR